MEVLGKGQIQFEMGKEAEGTGGQKSVVFFSARCLRGSTHARIKQKGATKASLAFCLFPVVQCE